MTAKTKKTKRETVEASLKKLAKFASSCGLRSDWHEPDCQGITARIVGTRLGWSDSDVPNLEALVAGRQEALVVVEVLDENGSSEPHCPADKTAKYRKRLVLPLAHVVAGAAELTRFRSTSDHFPREFLTAADFVRKESFHGAGATELPNEEGVDFLGWKPRLSWFTQVGTSFDNAMGDMVESDSLLFRRGFHEIVVVLHSSSTEGHFVNLASLTAAAAAVGKELLSQ